MVRFSKTSAFLPLLFLLGAVVRFVGLGSFPSGFFRDEAALGYNAYSLWLTGKDEYGFSFPIVFRSFEVFFLPLYVYLTVPIVGLLGLSEFSTRLLSASSGTALLVLTYFIAKEFWSKKAALFAVFVLIISPWHIFYSRGAFEGNLALTLFSAGFFFWLKFLKRVKVKFFALSILSFVLSIYSYQAERLVVPLFGIVALAFFPSELWKIRKKLIPMEQTLFILPLVVALVFVLPLLSLSLEAGGYHRLSNVSIFSQEGKPPGWIEGENPGLLLNNRLYLRTRQIVALYLSYFSPRNLFIEGDYDKQRVVENFSVFYAWMLPFLVLGLLSVVRKRSSGEKLLLAWMFIAPLPAALTDDPFHTYRSLLLYLPLSLFIGLGLTKACEWTKNNKLFFAGAFFISIISTSLFFFNYFVITQATRTKNWDYGYKQLVHFVLDVAPVGSISKVVVDDPRTDPYIHFLFFGKVHPAIYQAEVARLKPLASFYYSDSARIRPDKVSNYEFRRVDWPAERGDSGKIFVMSVERLPVSEFATDPNIELLKEIVYPGGEVAFRIVRVK